MSQIRLKLLLVDDSADFLRALSGFLTTQPNVQVVGMARSVEEAIARMMQADLPPDLVLMDINLAPGGMSGLAGTRQLKARMPGTPVIIVSLLDGQAYREAATAYGADGFVSKARLNSDLLPAIRSVTRLQ